jgi:hypothetical protein
VFATLFLDSLAPAFNGGFILAHQYDELHTELKYHHIALQDKVTYCIS